jgi:hypothetical protein
LTHVALDKVSHLAGLKMPLADLRQCVSENARSFKVARQRRLDGSDPLAQPVRRRERVVDGRQVRRLRSGSLVTKRTDACVYSDLRYSRFITFQMFSNRPAKSRAFVFGVKPPPAGGMGWAVIPTRQTAVEAAN